ncbi:MAG TPA: glycosyltransferase family 4 protein [Gaiellaceae bacterium]
MTEIAAGRRPTVAIVIHDLHDHGGMERAVVELIRRARDEFRLVVVSTTVDPELVSLVEWEHVRGVPRRPFTLKFLVFAVRAGLQLRRVRADLVHTMGAIVPNRSDLSTVQFVHRAFVTAAGRFSAPGSHGLVRWSGALSRFVSALAERWCYRPGRLRVAAVASPRVERDFVKLFPEIPTVLTPNGVDTARFRPDAATRAELRAQEGVGDHDVVALFVGGDWHRKGLDLAIQAVAGVRDTGLAVSLWVVGPGDDTPYREKGSAARFFGSRLDVERFMQAADLFVFPSLYEADPLVVLEAAASALPLVLTDASAVGVGDDAALVVERTAAGVAEGVRRLVADRDLRSAMGAAGVARAKELTWDRSTDELIGEYRRLMARESSQ